MLVLEVGGMREVPQVFFLVILFQRINFEPDRFYEIESKVKH